MKPQFETFAVDNTWILEDSSFRLEADYYSKEIAEARLIIRNLKARAIPVKEFSDKEITAAIIWPGRFKRKYTTKELGKPFLTSKEVLMLQPEAHKFIIDPPENIAVSKGTILVSRSGTIGRCVITGEILASSIISDDLIRVSVRNNDLLGYIYAYLNTWIGQAFLTKTKYGATVKHIEPGHISNLSLPIVDNAKEINDEIIIAYNLREKAQKLLLEAQKELHSQLDLPSIFESDVTYEDEKYGRITKTFTLNSSELNLRLDASYNQPLMRLIRHNLEKSSAKSLCTLKNLDKVGTIFTPKRFRRTYVENSDNGIPLIQGFHVPLFRPFGIKYQSVNLDSLSEYILEKNMILVTCSGTIGRTGLVREYWLGKAATNHITRVIPREINPGYLTCYLQSEYGRYQLEALSYGGVIGEIGEAGDLLNTLLIPIPQKNDIQDAIGNKVLEAYDSSDKAIEIEDRVIEKFEQELMAMADFQIK